MSDSVLGATAQRFLRRNRTVQTPSFKNARLSKLSNIPYGDSAYRSIAILPNVGIVTIRIVYDLKSPEKLPFSALLPFHRTLSGCFL